MYIFSSTHSINPFVLNAPFLYPPKTSENLSFFYVFGDKKRMDSNKRVNGNLHYLRRKNISIKGRHRLNVLVSNSNVLNKEMKFSFQLCHIITIIIVTSFSLTLTDIFSRNTFFVYIFQYNMDEQIPG